MVKKYHCCYCGFFSYSDQNRTLIGRNCCIKNEVCSLAFADKNLIYPVSKIESNMTVNREMEVVMNKALDISILN